MRALLLLAALGMAPTAMAQPLPLIPGGLAPGPASPEYNQMLVQQEQMRQQMVQQQNQLMVMEAQLHGQQSQQDIQALKINPRLALPNVSGAGALPQIDPSQLASIPDAALADSNKKVLDAARNHR
ncbi:MAG: hypothetical protein JWP50_59 [Phenylobacterium sp.]|nr:hypothetical protein [Phenylobacterium sp.]